jgi:hypothetical protein
VTPNGIPDHLPTPTGTRLPLPRSRHAGWWSDPGKSHPLAVRYHDGTDWTDFVCLVVRTHVGPIERIPLTPGSDAESPGSGGRPGEADAAHVTSLVWFIGLAFFAACLLMISTALPREGAAFDWLHRVGLLLLICLTASYGMRDLRAVVLGEGSDERPADRWLGVLIAVTVPALIIVTNWEGVLDALWLR